MTDDREPDQRPVTSMSLRAERLRVSLAKAAGAKNHAHDPRLSDPGLSPAPRVVDPELTNRWAKIGLAAGIVSVFVSTFGVPSIVAFVFCGLGLARARELGRRGKELYGRRRALWGIGLGAFGLLQAVYFLVVAKFL